MEKNRLTLYVCALWIASAIFTAARYICVAILQSGGSINDSAFRQMAVDSVGPFLPIMSIICLAGGLALLVVDLIVSMRKK